MLGDFNYNMLSKNVCKVIDKLCRQNNMQQLIKLPTRITETSSTLIDLILTTVPRNICHSDVVALGLSDHNIVYTVRKLYRPKVPPRVITYRRYRHFNEKTFISELDELDWSNCLVVNDIKRAWSTWKSQFMKICDKHAPLVTHRVKGRKTQWVSDEYVNLTRMRDRLKKKADKENANEDWVRYRSVRNQVNNLGKLLKRRFYHESVSENRKNPRILWKVLREVAPNDRTSIQHLNGLDINGVIETDLTKIVNEMNNYFVSIGSIVSTDLGNCNSTLLCSTMSDWNSYLAISSETFTFEESNEDFVRNELRKLQTTKSTRLDTISARLLKAAASVISKHFTHFFNLAIQLGKIPNEWKESKVTPVFKGGDRKDQNNYRPISVIPLVMKLMERAVHEQLQSFFVEHNMLVLQQSGFRKGHSTDTVLTYFTDYILRRMDGGCLTGVIFIDFRKAFDSVNHKILLGKLKYFGVKNVELAWFEDYLMNRRQRTVIGEKKSEWGQVKSGVPQGSILGPLLFTIMVNDLPHVITQSQIMLYANDAIIFYSSRSPLEIESILNSELKKIQAWVQTNKLAVNPVKTQFMLFGSPLKLATLSQPIKLLLDNQLLSQVDTYKYLGVWLDPTLSWKEHVRHTSKKIASRIALLSRAKRFLPLDSLKLLANSLKCLCLITAPLLGQTVHTIQKLYS